MKFFKREKYSRSGKDKYQKSLLKSTFPHDYKALKTKHLTTIKQALQTPQKFQQSFEFLKSQLAKQNKVISAKCLIIIDYSLNLETEDLNREILNLSIQLSQQRDPKQQLRDQTILLYLELLKVKASILILIAPQKQSISLKKALSFLSLILSLHEKLPQVKSGMILQITENILNQGSNQHRAIFFLLQQIFQNPKSYDSEQLKEFVQIIQNFCNISPELIHIIEETKRLYRLNIERPQFCHQLEQKIPLLQQSQIWNTQLLQETPLIEIPIDLSNRTRQVDIEQINKRKINYIINGFKPPQAQQAGNTRAVQSPIAPQSAKKHYSYMSPQFYPQLGSKFPIGYPRNMFQVPSRQSQEFLRPSYQNKKEEKNWL